MSRREELLDLAAEVLERTGLEGFGIGALARAAGVKPPSLYKHFSSLGDIETSLISRGFDEMASVFDHGPASDTRTRLAEFARTYRSQALAKPQLYRLMTMRPLNRDLLAPGVEERAMAGIISLFGETLERYDTARAAWAWAHGLVTLELTDRFPPGADIDAAWQVLVDTLSHSGHPGSHSGHPGSHSGPPGGQ